MDSCFPSEQWLDGLKASSFWFKIVGKKDIPVIPSLTSDCLNSLDCEALLKNLATVETLSCLFEQEATDAVKLQKGMFQPGVTPTTDLAVQFQEDTSWKDAVELIQTNAAALTKLSDNIRSDSTNLVQGNILSV